MVVVVSMIDHNDKAEEDLWYICDMLASKLGISSIRKYNRCVNAAIKANDVYAVRVMIGCKDRSMIRGGKDDGIYAVARYLGCKNIRVCIDDILSLSRNKKEKDSLCRSIAYGAAIHGHKDLVIEMIDMIDRHGDYDLFLDSIQCCDPWTYGYSDGDYEKGLC